jgi:hypothetical protein
VNSIDSRGLVHAGASLPAVARQKHGRNQLSAVSFAIGGILLVCTVLFAVPRTSVLGAILITAFLGGAICTHFRVGEIASPPQIVCVALGVAAWASLYLRIGTLRVLLPLTGRVG